MNTEIPDTKAESGWVCYDAECRHCRRLARQFEGVLAKRGFALAPLQDDWVRQRLGLEPGDPLREMIVITRDDQRFGGSEALLFLAGKIWWAKFLTVLARLPGMRGVLHRGYEWIAEHRHCDAGACETRRNSALWNWLGMILLPPAAFFFYDGLPPWAFMWVMVAAVFFGCKWLTFWATPNRHQATFFRKAAYFIGWPGMDARAFLSNERSPRPARLQWMGAAINAAIGAALLWGMAGNLAVNQPLAGGWVAMIGLALLLHFGLFHLLAMAWQAAGVNADPVMRAPTRATSLADFWGVRWNRGFTIPAKQFVFAPIARKHGAAIGMLAVFLGSALLHELVISVPARGGYGLPAAFFLFQAAALQFERTRIARRVGLGGGWRGWLFTLICTAGPAYWLFHPPFVNNVILPFMEVIGAMRGDGL